jgi:hypothetical protein
MAESVGEIDECAITTSPSSEADFEEGTEDEEAEEATSKNSGSLEEVKSSGARSAWQELWTGLTHLAGMED